MSKERELLERVMYMIPSSLISEHDLDLVDDIKELLAQPEQSSTTRHALDSYWNQEAYQRGYLKREPLSDEEVSELLMGGFSTHLMDLVRMVEKAHGIGGG